MSEKIYSQPAHADWCGNCMDTTPMREEMTPSCTQWRCLKCGLIADTVLHDTEEAMKYRIWSNGHQAWWRPNEQGYSQHRAGAGEYTRNHAELICLDANRHQDSYDPPNECMVPIREQDEEIR